MGEHEHDKNHPADTVTYASPLKRIWAWVGVAYMVIAVCLITYVLAFASFLRGIGGLMVCPALGGVAASLIYLRQTGSRTPGKTAAFVALEALCLALFILGLWDGIPALIANFGVR